MIIKLLVDAADMKPGPAIGQKLGPLGINIGKVIAEVNKATASFKGMKVPVSLDINTKTEEFTVKVSTPPTTELFKKELAIEKGSAEPQKTKVGNVALEQIIAIAKIKEKDMLSDFKHTVKSIVGTCVSMGILIESKDPKKILEEINSGKYDDIIAEQKTKISEEKKAKLKADFEVIQKKQEEKRRAEEVAEEAKEAKEKAAEEKPEEEKAKEITGEEKPEEKKAEAEEKKESKEKKR